MKIVIVTGSSRGLGASTALECAKRGMGLIVTYNSNPEKAEEVAKAIAGMGGINAQNIEVAGGYTI